MTDQIPYRLLPAVDRLLRLQDGIAPGLAKEAANRLLDEIRVRLETDWPPAGGEDSVLGDGALARRLEELRGEITARYHRRAINATGILLHTGLGRAPLPAAAARAIAEVARQSVVEVEPDTGKRGRRENAVAAGLCRLTGAEAALVVNNNAAATLLGLDALARGRSVPVSRGELVEIGGGFRMPDVMARAGCRLVEVGATNRTRIRDYEDAITEDTGCLLKVHPSNYRIEGFTESVPLAELVALGKKHGLAVFEDLGSGYLLDEPLPHDRREPSVMDSLRAGADLVCFSGDKLFGSCQAGILVGKKQYVAACASHPLYRALRLDKISLAALEATLSIYLYGQPKREIPVLRAIYTDAEQVRARGEAVIERFRHAVASLGYEAELSDNLAYVGSGATPARSIASFALVAVPREPRIGVEELARRLRLQSPSIWARIEDGRLVFDLRSPAEGEEDEIIVALSGVASE